MAYENSNQNYQRTKMQKDMIIKRLREEGCRITKQRRMLLDVILEEGVFLLQRDLLSGIQGRPGYWNGYGLSYGK